MTGLRPAKEKKKIFWFLWTWWVNFLVCQRKNILWKKIYFVKYLSLNITCQRKYLLLKQINVVKENIFCQRIYFFVKENIICKDACFIRASATKSTVFHPAFDILHFSHISLFAFLSSPRALSARGLLLADGPPHWGGGKESESWSHEKSMLAVLVQILLKSCFENGKLWETKKVSAREKTKQPIAGPVLMSFCSTNWN